MQRVLGAQVAKSLKLRIAELMWTDDMSDLLLGTGRWEELTADRSGQWSARLTGNNRLVVQPEDGDGSTVSEVEINDNHHNPPPRPERSCS
jgi:proteic killer suppression protein